MKLSFEIDKGQRKWKIYDEINAQNIELETSIYPDVHLLVRLEKRGNFHPCFVSVPVLIV
jgi:hypothetical protein